MDSPNEVPEEVRIPTRVEIHADRTDDANLQEYRKFLMEKGLEVGVYLTQKVKLPFFELEFYNKDDLLIDVLCCPYEGSSNVNSNK